MDPQVQPGITSEQREELASAVLNAGCSDRPPHRYTVEKVCGLILESEINLMDMSHAEWRDCIRVLRDSAQKRGEEVKRGRFPRGKPMLIETRDDESQLIADILYDVQMVGDPAPLYEKNSERICHIQECVPKVTMYWSERRATVERLVSEALSEEDAQRLILNLDECDVQRRRSEVDARDGWELSIPSAQTRGWLIRLLRETLRYSQSHLPHSLQLEDMGPVQKDILKFLEKQGGEARFKEIVKAVYGESADPSQTSIVCRSLKGLIDNHGLVFKRDRGIYCLVESPQPWDPELS